MVDVRKDLQGQDRGLTKKQGTGLCRREAEAGGGQPSLHGQLRYSQGYTEEPLLKNKERERERKLSA